MKLNNEMYWYTIISFWADHLDGGSNILWYIRKVHNCITLSPFLTEDEIYNRKLQLQYVLKRSKNFLSYSNMELSNCTLHMYNYMWAYNMVKHDIVLCGKIKEYSENIKTGLIVTPKFRNHHSILYKILQSKLKMLADI